MADLRCTRGHVVNSSSAVECPTCGAPVQDRSAAGMDASLGVALIVVGLVLSVVAAVLLVTNRPDEGSVYDSSGMVLVLSTVLGLLGSTAWLIGCIAEGVRIGRRG